MVTKNSLLKSMLFSKSNKFQSVHTEIWNSNTNKVAKFVIPPVSLADEMTNDGFERAILELLELAGILWKKSVTTKKGSTIDKWCLTKTYEKKDVFMHGWTITRTI